MQHYHDENRFNVLFYDRTTNTPASAEKATPKRSIGGPKTQLQLSSNTCRLFDLMWA